MQEKENNDLFDSEEYSLNAEMIDKVIEVDLDREKGFIKIRFTTKDGNTKSLISEYEKFIEWLSKSVNEFSDIFSQFLYDFISSSEETQELQEFIDTHGNIDGSNEIPDNESGRMVGLGQKWDLEKIGRNSIQRPLRFYSGDLGVGIVAW